MNLEKISQYQVQPVPRVEKLADKPHTYQKPKKKKEETDSKYETKYHVDITA